MIAYKIKVQLSLTGLQFIIIIKIYTTTKYGPCESTTWPVSFYTN